MKRITVLSLITLAATLAACADVTAPAAQLVERKMPIASEVICFQPDPDGGCTVWTPPEPPPLVPGLQPGCFFELRYDENGNLIEVLVCP